VDVVRLFYVSRRAVVVLSMLAVVVSLVVTLKIVSENPTVAAWVSASWQNADSAAVSLPVATDSPDSQVSQDLQDTSADWIWDFSDASDYEEAVNSEAAEKSDNAVDVDLNDSNGSNGAMLSEPDVAAAGALLLDAETGRILWEENGLTSLPPASTTKILTALLCLDLAPLDREVEVSASAAAVGESSVGLLAGERFTLGELLNAALIKSANDACYAIAEGVAGSEPYFVHLLNVKAAALGAFGANLLNTNGLPAEGHVLSCYDLALLARQAMENAEFRERVGSRYGSMNGGSYNRSLKNTNKLLNNEYVTGIKTGTTNAAGACLVSSMERDGRSVIAVVLHSSDRYNDSLELLNYGIDGFQNVTVVRQGQQLGVYDVGENEGVAVLAENDLCLTLPLNMNKNEENGAVYYRYVWREFEPNMQIKAGEVLGTLVVENAAGERLGLVNLLAVDDWQDNGWLARLQRFFNSHKSQNV
jgi:D-alanyl-D-alanine carboxypeptidase (penicillin-binding protein 5/6)